MKLLIDKEYLNSLNKIAARTKKHNRLYDYSLGATLSCDTDGNQLHIWYSTKHETKQAVYSIKDIKRCEVHANGCLILFRDRKFVFLPVTNDEDNDSDLLILCEFLESELDGLHFFVISRLNYLVDEKTGKRARIGFSLSDSPTYIIIISLLAVVMATVFVNMKNDFAVVKRSECHVFTGTFDSYDQDHKCYIELYFTGDEMLEVHHSCGSEALFDKLDALEKGDQVAVLVNPNVDYVVEIKTEEQEILNFEKSQELMLKDATGFMWLGIAVYCGAAYLFVYGIYMFIKERKDAQ
jgi:hypothetical protein